MLEFISVNILFSTGGGCTQCICWMFWLHILSSVFGAICLSVCCVTDPGMSSC